MRSENYLKLETNRVYFQSGLVGEYKRRFPLCLAVFCLYCDFRKPVDIGYFEISIN